MKIFSLKKITLILFLSSVNTCLFAQLDMGGSKGSKPDPYAIQGEQKPFSSVQKKFQSKIVFASEEIEYENEDPSTFKKEFNLGDPIYSRSYYNETIEKKGHKYVKQKRKDGEIFKTTYHDYAIGEVISINGKEILSRGFVLSPKRNLSDVTRPATIFNPNSKEKPYGGGTAVLIRNAFLKLGKEFKPGKFDIKIEAFAFSTKANANKGKESDRIVSLYNGNLTINVTEEGIKKYLPALCRYIKKPVNALEDIQLEKEILELFNKKNTGKSTAKIAYLISPEWEIKRNAYGVILRKFINAKIVYQTVEGRTRFIQYKLKKEYDGEKYASIVYQNSFDDESICSQCIDWYNSNK